MSQENREPSCWPSNYLTSWNQTCQEQPLTDLKDPAQTGASSQPALWDDSQTLAVNLPIGLASTLNPYCTQRRGRAQEKRGATLQHLHGFAVMALMEEWGKRLRKGGGKADGRQEVKKMVVEGKCGRQNQRVEVKRKEQDCWNRICLVWAENWAASQTTGNLRERLSDWRRQHLDKEIAVLSAHAEGREGYPSSFAGR